MNQGMVCCRIGLMMHLKIEGKIRVKIEGKIFSVKIGLSMNHNFWVTIFKFFCISSVFISRIHNVRDKTSLSLVKYFCWFIFRIQVQSAHIHKFEKSEIFKILTEYTKLIISSRLSNTQSFLRLIRAFRPARTRFWTWTVGPYRKSGPDFGPEFGPDLNLVRSAR